MLFLGLISPISLGLKTFMFPWVLGVHAGSYHLLSILSTLNLEMSGREG